MNQHVPPVAEFSARLDHLKRDMMTRVETVATELRRDTPVDAARIEGEVLELTNLTRAFFGFFQTLSQSQSGGAPGSAGVASPEWQGLQTQAGLLRLAVNQWPRIRDLIGEQTPSRRRPLFRKPSAAEALIRSQEEIEDRLVDRLHHVLNSKSQSGVAEARGCYGDIGLPSSLFAQLLHAAYRVLLAQGKRSDTAFVDVGCGGGLKVLTASALFDHAVGLEFDTGYASSARRLFKSARAETCEVLRTDALTCEGYGAFDVIYLYRPMEDADAMSALEERILEQAQPGAIVVAPYRGFLERHTAFDCAHIADALFLARATKSEARRLRRRAEFIGTALPPVKPVKAPPSIWDPVLSASHSNGFRLLEERPRLPA